MTTLYCQELGQPDGAEGARREFHRRKTDVAPFDLSRLIPSSLTTPLMSLLSCNSFFFHHVPLIMLVPLSRMATSFALQPIEVLTILPTLLWFHSQPRYTVLNYLAWHKAPTLLLPPCLELTCSFFFFSIFYILLYLPKLVF